jgi:predicted DNA-binding transcriptional regulator AlpA
VTTEALRADLSRLVAEAPTEELPAVVGALVEAEERVRVRLRSLEAAATVRPAEQAPERLLTAQEAMALVGGNVSLKWIYRHTRGLRFRRDISRKCVRFEESGLRRWLAARTR